MLNDQVKEEQMRTYWRICQGYWCTVLINVCHSSDPPRSKHQDRDLDNMGLIGEASGEKKGLEQSEHKRQGKTSDPRQIWSDQRRRERGKEEGLGNRVSPTAQKEVPQGCG
jgi:hypothetical protein